MRVAHPVTKIAIFAAVGATVLAACGTNSNNQANIGPSGAFGKVPAATGTPHAGTITVSEPPNATPTWLFPVTPGANSSVYTAFSFQYEMFRPLYWIVNGVSPVEYPPMSMAADPVWSNGDKTVTVKLKGWKWSDGQAITSKDLLFWIDIAKVATNPKYGGNAANWGNYVGGVGVPDQIVSMATPDANTLVLNLNAAVNPQWFFENELPLIQPIPAHAWARTSANGPILDFTNLKTAAKIYAFLAAQSKDTKTYASNPLWKVVDGPYTLTAFDSTTGAYTMVPNAGYGGPHVTPQSTLQAVPFTSDTAEFNAVKSGSIDVGYIPQTDVPQVNSVKGGYNVYGYPGFGFNYIAYNFKDKTGNFNSIIAQLYFRQAFAHLEDEAGYIRAFFHGAGGQAYGPVPSIPATPYTPASATHNPFPFSVNAATSLLKSHGWTIHPAGTDVCTNAGTGANQCGAGIPAGTPLAFNLIYGSNPAIIGQQVTDLTSQARKAGINITLKSDNFNHMIATYYDAANPKGINLWAMEDFGGFSISAYPTMLGIFNSTGSFNIGEYTDPAADTLIKASTTSSNRNAVKAEADYLTLHQPGLFEPLPDNIVTWKKGISGNPLAFEMVTQYQLNPEFWYFVK